MHWELQYYEIFKNKGGFDLIVGNPPWVKVLWQKEYILSEFEPIIGLRGYSASKVDVMVNEILQTEEQKSSLYSDFIGFTGSKNYFNSHTNYPYLVSLQSNLYKCFLTKSWYLGNRNGITGLIHEAELLSESKGILKRATFNRLHLFYHFINELQLFSEVLHGKKFAVSITSCSEKDEISFYSIVNLYHPITLDQSIANDGIGLTPSIKTQNNEWDIRGHKNRIIKIEKDELKVFNGLFEDGDVEIIDTRLPFLHSIEILEVIKILMLHKIHARDFNYSSNTMFHETYAQNDGYIIERVNIPKNINEVVLSGPNIHVSNSFYQEVPEHYRNYQDYKILDLNEIQPEFLPRTVYGIGNVEYPSDEINIFRNAHRYMVFPMAERTLISSIIPPKVKHINGIISKKYKNNNELTIFTGFASTIILDFFVKILNKTNLSDEIIDILPLVKHPNWRIKSRTLRLNCLTKDYAPLWESEFDERFIEDSFCKEDNRYLEYNNLTCEWDWHTPLRNFYERRQALVELDALVALELNISLESLLAIYRIQFPILNKNERGTWYDQKGKVVFSVNTAYRPLNNKEAFDSWDGKSTEPIEGYIPPFETCDREKDMKQAYEYFGKIIEEES